VKRQPVPVRTSSSPTFPQPLIWLSSVSRRHNRGDMDLSPDQVEEIELMLEKLETLDPADLPEPAAELVDLLARILDDRETDS